MGTEFFVLLKLYIHADVFIAAFTDKQTNVPIFSDFHIRADGSREGGKACTDLDKNIVKCFQTGHVEEPKSSDVNKHTGHMNGVAKAVETCKEMKEGSIIVRDLLMF